MKSCTMPYTRHVPARSRPPASGAARRTRSLGPLAPLAAAAPPLAPRPAEPPPLPAPCSWPSACGPPAPRPGCSADDPGPSPGSAADPGSPDAARSAPVRVTRTVPGSERPRRKLRGTSESQNLSALYYCRTSAATHCWQDPLTSRICVRRCAGSGSVRRTRSPQHLGAVCVLSMHRLPVCIRQDGHPILTHAPERQLAASMSACLQRADSSTDASALRKCSAPRQAPWLSAGAQRLGGRATSVAMRAPWH